MALLTAERPAHTVPRPAADPAVWVATLYAVSLLVQRLAIPGTEIALALPLVLAWAALALHRGVLELSRTRVLVWLAAYGACGVVLLVQALGGFAAHTSVPSYGLFAVTWAPLVLALRDRTWAAFRRTGDLLVSVGLGLAGLSLLFMGVQVAGLRYVDIVGSVVPESALVPGYVTTYPVAYGSVVMRSNAWIGLEASVVSFHLGALVLAAILLRRSLLVIGVLVAGLLTTTSGSGVVVLLLGLAALAVSRRHDVLRPLAVPGAVGLGTVLLTPVGWSLLRRTTEFQNDDSSSNLRATRGYADLWPGWRDSLPAQWLGSGAGAAQQRMEDIGVVGLVAPTGARLFYDYGLLCGGLLLAVLLVAAWRSWAGALAVGVVVSFLTLQPATTNTCLVLVLVLWVTLWSPRREGADADGPRGSDGPAGPPPARPMRAPDGPAVDLGPPTEILGVPALAGARHGR